MDLVEGARAGLAASAALRRAPAPQQRAPRAAPRPETWHAKVTQGRRYVLVLVYSTPYPARIMRQSLATEAL